MSTKPPTRQEGRRTVGTPDYLAPEVLQGKGCLSASDWWSVGCILYQMLIGYPPFNDSSPEDIFDNILARRLDFPPQEAWGDETPPSKAAMDIIERLLDLNPATRLGANGADEVKAHPFFKGINWESLSQTAGHFVPNTEDDMDTQYFSPKPISAKSMADDTKDIPAVVPTGPGNKSSKMNSRDGEFLLPPKRNSGDGDTVLRSRSSKRSSSNGDAVASCHSPLGLGREPSFSGYQELNVGRDSAAVAAADKARIARAAAALSDVDANWPQLGKMQQAGDALSKLPSTELEDINTAELGAACTSDSTDSENVSDPFFADFSSYNLEACMARNQEKVAGAVSIPEQLRELRKQFSSHPSLDGPEETDG